jgi:transposase InsO family protein
MPAQTGNGDISTVVDVFSRRCWLRKLKKKEATNTRDAFGGTIRQEDVSPKFLLSDNGTEFLGEFQEYCKEKDIKQFFTRSYSPQANSVWERTNKEVRKIIHSFWIRQENTVWYDILPQLEANKKATYNSTVKGSPASIYENTRKEIKLNAISQDSKQVAKMSVLRRAKRKMDEFKKTDALKVGDIVGENE